MVKSCSNCFRTETPSWRKGINGEILCNACGIYLKQQGRNRPLDLEHHRASGGAGGKKKKVLVESKLALPKALAEKPISTARFRKGKPIKVTSLTVVPDYFKYSDENSVSPYSRGPTEISFRNQKYQIGNYVAVKGLEHEEYYGIIVGFDVGANGSKRFWMRWIAPKEGRLARHKLPDTSFDMNDFTEVKPHIITIELMDSIKYVFDSVSPEYIIYTDSDQSRKLQEALETTVENIKEVPISLRKVAQPTSFPIQKSEVLDGECILPKFVRSPVFKVQQETSKSVILKGDENTGTSQNIVCVSGVGSLESGSIRNQAFKPPQSISNSSYPYSTTSFPTEAAQIDDPSHKRKATSPPYPMNIMKQRVEQQPFPMMQSSSRPKQGNNSQFHTQSFGYPPVNYGPSNGGLYRPIGGNTSSSYASLPPPWYRWVPPNSAGSSNYPVMRYMPPMNSNNINGSQNRPPSSAGMMYYVPQPNMTNNGNMFPPPNSHPDRMGPPMINPRSNSGMMLNRPQLKPVEPINTNLKIPELTPPCTTNTSAISSNTSSRASSPMCRLVHDPKTMQNEV